MLTRDDPLHEHYEAILTAVETLLAAAAQPAGLLSDITGTLRGDRAQISKIKPPCLWIFPGPDIITPAGGQANIHNVEVIVVAMVQSVNPEVGPKQASDLAGRAYTILMQDRTWGGTVHAVQAKMFEPSNDRFKSTQIYAAAAALVGQVRRRE